MRKIDRAALELALQQTLAEKDQSRVEQVQSMLKGRTRLGVSQFCSFHRQIAALKLRPWELPPCMGGFGQRQRRRRAGLAAVKADAQGRCVTLASVADRGMRGGREAGRNLKVADTTADRFWGCTTVLGSDAARASPREGGAVLPATVRLRGLPAVGAPLSDALAPPPADFASRRNLVGRKSRNGFPGCGPKPSH